jgi:CspA family cold shock protein
MNNELMGTVKWFDEKKGWGFITTQDISSDIFVHYKHIQQDGYKTLVRDELVVFTPIDTSKGVMATKVKRINQDGVGNEAGT